MSPKASMSPLTQGGLEIKSEVSVDWGIEDSNMSNKCSVLKSEDLHQENYSLETTLQDDSAAILLEINRLINSSDVEATDIMDDVDMDEDSELIMMVNEQTMRI